MNNNLFLKTGGAMKNYNRSFKSPVFPFANSSTITASSTYLFDYHRDNLNTEKYGSFNFARITNNSSQEILVYPNQDRNAGINVPASSVIVIDEQTIGATTSILIENVGTASINANQIRLQVWKNKADADSIIERTHQRLFNVNYPTMKKNITSGSGSVL